MKRNSLLTFCFAFIPGAGQMYLGMMKRGVSLMLAFTLIGAVSGFLYLPLLAVVLPVLWFYSFFDTFNLKALTQDERFAQDAFLFCLDEALSKDWLALMQKRHILIGGGSIALGIYLLFNSVLRPILWRFTDYLPWLDGALRAVPSMIVSFAVILLGVRLLRGAKHTSLPPAEEDFVEYGGKEHE